MSEKAIGNIVLTEAGEVVLLTRLNELGDMQGDGRVPTFDLGVLLRGSGPLGARREILYERPVHVVSHIKNILELLEQSGADLKTLPEVPLDMLDPLERIARLERENAALSPKEVRGHLLHNQIYGIKDPKTCQTQ